MARNLIVHILGDATQLTRSFNQSTVAANQFGAKVSGSMGKAEKGMLGLQRVAAGAFIGGAAAAAISSQGSVAIQVASDLNEQATRSRVVFRESADEIEKWSKTTAEGMGLAQAESLRFAGTFGLLFTNLGESSQQAATFSESLVKLASDLASFNNVPVEDALAAIRSGLTGEIEPLRRFGVFLSEARTRTEALAKTGKTSAAALTTQEKVLARMAILFRDTNTAQGDFERTSGSLANQQRILAARTQELKANIGTALLPIMTSLTAFTGKAVVAVQDLGQAINWLGRQKITPLQIPINFTIVSDQGGGDLKAGDIFKFRIDEIVGLGIDAALGRGVFGKGERKVSSQEVTAGAKAFDDAFTPFTDSLVKSGNAAAEKAGKKVKDALSKGSKMLDSNKLGESLQRAFDRTMDALDLKFDRAVFSESTSGALAALNEIEAAVRKRMETEGRTTELLRLLFQVDQDRAAVIAGAKAAKQARIDELVRKRKDDAEKLKDKLRELAEARAKLREAARQALETKQFKALGVGAGGEEFIPGMKNLRKQFAQLSDSVIGQDVPAKLLSRLALVGKALSKGGKALQPEVRRWIADLFGTIRGEFDKEEKKGPLTKTTSLNANRILEGLGLGPEAERLARSRLSRINSAGIGLAGARTPTGNFQAVGAGTQPIVVSTTVQLDSDVVGRSVTKVQQKGKRQNPTQKRGPNSGV